MYDSRQEYINKKYVKSLLYDLKLLKEIQKMVCVFCATCLIFLLTKYQHSSSNTRCTKRRAQYSHTKTRKCYKQCIGDQPALFKDLGEFSEIKI